MAPQQKPPDGMSYREQATLFFNLLMSMGWLIRMGWTQPGTAGYRETRNINAWWSLGILTLWALFSQSPWLMYAGLPLALIVIFDNRMKSKRESSVHTYFIGRSKLARLVGDRMARPAEVVFTFAIGAALVSSDKGAGTYLMLASIGHWATITFVRVREQAVRDDISDAQIESMSRAGGQESRPLF